MTPVSGVVCPVRRAPVGEPPVEAVAIQSVALTAAVGFLTRLVIAATPPTPCPGQPPLTGVELAELELYEVVPVVAVIQ